MASVLSIPGLRVGIGGFHLGKPEDPELGVEIVRHALDNGITFIDNSWDYHEGESERRVGRALSETGYRGRAFVMTKVDGRSYDGVMRQFSESLERLATDHVDLLQLHEVIREDDPEKAVEGGALRALAELREQRAARHIGCTGHKRPHMVVGLIDAAVEQGIHLETAQVPVNPLDLVKDSFTKAVFPLLEERGVAVLGMKPLASGEAFEGGALNAPELLRWTLSQPVAICITGCENVAEVDQAIAAARDFVPMTAEEQSDLERRCSDIVSRRPEVESYKYTDQHDGTLQHPEWLA